MGEFGRDFHCKKQTKIAFGFYCLVTTGSTEAFRSVGLKKKVQVVNDEDRRREQRLDLQDSSEIEAKQLKWRMGWGRGRSYSGLVTGHTREHSRARRRHEKCK